MSYWCKNCGMVGNKILKKDGSKVLMILLFLFGIYPGILYSRWRDSTTRYVCERCGKDDMVRLTVEVLRGQL